MSEFDKEAEREKLRKQFADDEQDREETERMSELLLQGATMTNKHCETCGSPLFRQNGATFCPTCGGDGRTAPSGSAGAQRAQGAADQSAAEPAGSGSEADAASGAEPARNPSVSGPDRGTTGTPAPDTRVPTDGEADLGVARESLVRTATAFARRAEAAENPGHARELLATVREAAETLDAVDRVRRNR